MVFAVNVVRNSRSFPSQALRITLALALLGLPVLGTGCQAQPKAEKAQEHLDKLLGQNNNQQNEPAPQQEQADPFGGFPDWARKLTPGQPDIQVQENAKDYTITITLANPQDANSVKVNVSPHQIQISGQSSFGKDGMQGSSSFFKSFSTSTELIPNQVKREESEKKLTFTVPKTTASTPQIQSAPTQTLPQSKQSEPKLSPDVLRQLDESQGRAI